MDTQPSTLTDKTPTSAVPNAAEPDVAASNVAEDSGVTEAVHTAAPGSNEPSWPALSEGHPLAKLTAQLPDILREADYAEVYGITLQPDAPFHTKLILQKYLRANQNDLAKAREQLLATLKWRREFQPLKAVEEVFSRKRFGGLGYVCVVDGVPGSVNGRDVVTFNIYGAVKDNKATFGDLEGFLRWRVALMELTLQKLSLTTATTPIPDYGAGPDPYQAIQVHDYLQVSFLRQDPVVKTATRKTIDTFSRYYPETLSRKFFVNVPVIMGWMFSAMKMVLSKETVKKFTVLSYGNQLAGELGSGVPGAYGGKAGALEGVGEAVKLEG
ncbi:hypothetical protein W97_03900 [Coniosporium apollinis CBS 100218]|uniref:Phosphatidylinositol transfer protein SFH5 n=1 Tax=Coniosporium apollinis (strain CBS 100218) TaxID=1168221 RepID=R7YRX4_CONA1|nr:uncharacterized protein W97_03900 [Coniosporium apollinis CBS 100218]EON64667.1 hypothetical protein W97_03900 [Coniosporium apollinis CBS 100218]